jgi:fructan beta-fructosidase
LAYSLDRGRHWDKYLGNPVLDIGEADFRDPKVFWHEPTRRWVMVVAMAAEKRIRFYGSADLKTWKFLSEFGPAGAATKSNWECPDLFELPIVGEPGQSRWVLEVDMGGGAVAGGSGGEYFIGVFDGERFVPDSSDAQWVDYGRDFYAPVSWSDIPEADGRRIWIGWMNNWETCLNPTYPWRSAMSVPRELTLRRIGGRLRLCQRPVRELESYRGERVGRHDLELSDESMTLGQLGQQLEIMVEFRNETASAFGVRVLKGTGQQTTVVYDDKTRTLSVDRTESGNTSFHPAFPGVHGGPLEPSEGGVVRMRILVDSSSVEVFGNDGETVITDLVFPDEASGGVEIFATGGKCRVLSLEAYPLRSATPGIHPPDE